MAFIGKTMSKLRHHTIGKIPEVKLPSDAAAQIEKLTGIEGKQKLSDLCLNIEQAGKVLASIRAHDAISDDWTVTRDKLDALLPQYRELLKSLARLDGDTLDLIDQHHFIEHRKWIDLSQHHRQLESVAAAVASFRATIPTGKQKDRSLGDTLAILCEAYTKATGRPATHKATRFIDFLSLVGPWINLPTSSLDRHLKNIGTK